MSKKQSSTPHDALFKLFLRQPETAREHGAAGVNSKHIRQRDLIGLVEQMACLLSSGYANDRQIKGLFNYILQTGDAVRFNDFIDGVAERSPKHKVSLMTIAERLRQEGEQSKALHIAKIMLESGVPLADIMRFTGVSEEELAAASQ